MEQRLEIVEAFADTICFYKALWNSLRKGRAINVVVEDAVRLDITVRSSLFDYGQFIDHSRHFRRACDRNAYP